MSDSQEDESVKSEPQSRPSGLLRRIAALFGHSAPPQDPVNTSPRFRVGERVKNHWGEFGTVVQIDAKANGGSGSIQIRLEDGRKQTMDCIASGLEKISEPK